MRAIKWSFILLIVAAAMGLLAFGPRANESLPKDRVVIDYWEKWTGNEEAQMRVIVNDFNNTVGAQKGIFVRYVSSSTINQKTLVATAAGVPPDIAGLFDANLVQFASMGALEPLEDMARAHGITESYYKPVYWNGCNYNGHLWALISTPTVVALHYNTRIFHENAAALRAAGLDPDRAPQTIDELDAYARVLTIREPSGRVIRAGSCRWSRTGMSITRAIGSAATSGMRKHRRFTLTSAAGGQIVRMDSKLRVVARKRRDERFPQWSRQFRFAAERVPGRYSGHGNAGTVPGELHL